MRRIRRTLGAFAVAVAVLAPAGTAGAIHGDKNLTIAARECTEADIGGGFNCTDYSGNRFHCQEFYPSGDGGGIATGCGESH